MFLIDDKMMVKFFSGSTDRNLILLLKDGKIDFEFRG